MENGFNVVRLYVAWPGLEPTKGNYNLTYLNVSPLAKLIMASLDYGTILDYCCYVGCRVVPPPRCLLILLRGWARPVSLPFWTVIRTFGHQSFVVNDYTTKHDRECLVLRGKPGNEGMFQRSKIKILFLKFVNLLYGVFGEEDIWKGLWEL